MSAILKTRIAGISLQSSRGQLVLPTGRKLLLAGLLATAAAPALADRVVIYTIDPSHTQVRFTWRDSGVPTSGGVFKQVSGTIWGNQDHPELSQAEVIMPVKSLDTSVSVLNKMLVTSGQFFKSEEFPEVSFKSRAITEGDMKTGSFKVLGTLTVNGISKPVILSTKLVTNPPNPPYEGAQSVGFEATSSFKRSDFGMGKYVPIVSDEIKVSIKVQAIESVAYQKVQGGVKTAAP